METYPWAPDKQMGTERLREVQGLSWQHTATKQLILCIPTPHLLAAAKQKPPGPTSVTAGPPVTAERRLSEQEASSHSPALAPGRTETLPAQSQVPHQGAVLSPGVGPSTAVGTQQVLSKWPWAPFTCQEACPSATVSKTEPAHIMCFLKMTSSWTGCHFSHF